jgi:hypothetical protein
MSSPIAAEILEDRGSIFTASLAVVLAGSVICWLFMRGRFSSQAEYIKNEVSPVRHLAANDIEVPAAP